MTAARRNRLACTLLVAGFVVMFVGIAVATPFPVAGWLCLLAGFVLIGAAIVVEVPPPPPLRDRGRRAL